LCKRNGSKGLHQEKEMGGGKKRRMRGEKGKQNSKSSTRSGPSLVLQNVGSPLGGTPWGNFRVLGRRRRRGGENPGGPLS